jgi:uncharacterized membrane protein YkvA (DUF1232 family)
MFNRSSQAPTPQAKLGLLAELVRDARLVWRLITDSRVALAIKLVIPGLMALYILSPVDFIPDVIPVLGQLDDLVVLVLAVKLFIELCPKDIVRQYKADLAGQGTPPQSSDAEGEVIDADYHVVR